MSVTFRPAVLIPCFNHGKFLRGVVASLEYLNVPCLIVDDGSNEETYEQIETVASEFPWVSVFHRSVNGGKGAAVIEGAKILADRGFSHFLQIDADGQHDASKAAKLLELSANNPEALISGCAQYDASVPKERLYGRKITNFWVVIETRTTKIQDCFCGFRVYPITSFLSIERTVHIGKRMDFDIEIMVRFYWRKVPILFTPVSVKYPEGGISHFDVVKDNLLISGMHTRLVLESLFHWPELKKSSNVDEHWSHISERKGLNGFRFLLKCYKFGGRKVFQCLLTPVIYFFWLSGKRQRKASIDFLKKVNRFEQSKGKQPTKYSNLQHFQNFGNAILEKFIAWDPENEFDIDRLIIDPESEKYLVHTPGKRGRLVLVSHLGVSEACRAVAENKYGIKINALVYEVNSPRVRELLDEVNQQRSTNLIFVNEIGMETAIILEEKISQGEWVAIAADRTPVNMDGRDSGVLFSSFLGEKAPFPIGPYLLASILKCEVVTLFAVPEGEKIRVECRLFSERISLPRKERMEKLQECVDQYAKLLEEKAAQWPLHWFNFYDFWQEGKGENGK